MSDSPAAIVDTLTERERVLTTALGDLLVAIGGATKGQPLTGPQLLLLADDAIEHFTANPPPQARSDGA
jgi:hypothetical protein